MSAGSRRQCLFLSLGTLIRECDGRRGRGQSGGGAVEVAMKRSMATGMCEGCFFRKSKGEMRMLDWVLGRIGYLPVTPKKVDARVERNGL